MSNEILILNTKKQIDEITKEVVVSSEKGLHYTNVLSHTYVEEIFTLDQKNQIKIMINKTFLMLQNGLKQILQ